MRTLKTAFISLIFFIATPLFAEEKPDSPLSIDGAVSINTEQAKKLFDKEVTFIDVRKDKDWAAGRIPGAEHLELKKVFSEASLTELVKKDDDIVIYCNGPKCLRSSKASTKAVSWGFTKVHYYRDGMPAWKNAKYPVE
ncbi:MAG: rhodanese-like domain-containing protein [Gammaproteobacteria bacterium]|nr:rhodanese-like domain-containing protein [Gammaproteobacteria bacterium]MDH5387866.1 rhodanese-like domain-containing protein [Gammaproteobacteria bacterium]